MTTALAMAFWWFAAGASFVMTTVTAVQGRATAPMFLLNVALMLFDVACGTYCLVRIAERKDWDEGFDDGWDAAIEDDEE